MTTSHAAAQARPAHHGRLPLRHGQHEQLHALHRPDRGRYQYAAGFYSGTAETIATRTPAPRTGNSVWGRGSAGTEVLRVYLASVNSSGVHTLSTSFGQVTMAASTAARALSSMTGVTVTVPVGSKLAVIYQWGNDATAVSSATASDLIGVDNNAAGTNQVTLTAVQIDNTAPDWASSGDLRDRGHRPADDRRPADHLERGDGQRLPATPAGEVRPLPGPAWARPVGDRLEPRRDQLHRRRLTAPYLVLRVVAKDSKTPTPNSRNATDRPPATPTPLSLAAPPATPGRRRAARTRRTWRPPTRRSTATPCLKCHGDVSGYTTSHQNGLVNFSFRLPDGTTPDGGAAGAYSAAATPGVVTGTCSNVDCHFEIATQAWNNATNLTCTSCHGATLPDAHGAHTGSRALPQTGQNDCFACHDTVVNTLGRDHLPELGASTIASALHLNGTGNVQLDPAYASTLTPRAPARRSPARR